MRRVRPDALAGYVDSSWFVETHTTELLNILRLRRTGWRATTATHRSRRLTAQPQTFTAARMNFGVAQVTCNLCREVTRGQQYSTLQTSCGCAAPVGKQPVATRETCLSPMPRLTIGHLLPEDQRLCRYRCVTMQYYPNCYRLTYSTADAKGANDVERRIRRKNQKTGDAESQVQAWGIVFVYCGNCRRAYGSNYVYMLRLPRSKFHSC
jgi:hypothetical protein